jgi:uncharacterized membrane protein
VVCYNYTGVYDAEDRRAFSWTAAAGMIDLPTFPGFSFTEALAVNDAGQIVGSIAESGGTRRATLWDANAHPARAVADTYVRAGRWAATTFGAATVLQVKKGSSPDNTRRSYVKFDISAVPPVDRVVLRLYGHLSNDSTREAQTTVYAVSDSSWGEHTLTWNTRPDLGAVIGTVRVRATSPHWFEIDVTGFVRSEQRAGHKIVSLALRNILYSSAYVEFASRESGSVAPQLVIRP